MSSNKDRTWEVYTDPFHVDDDEQLSIALNEALILCNRMGCGLIIAPKRREVFPGSWVTEGYIFKATYFPATRYEEPGEEAPVVEPEPAAA